MAAGQGSTGPTSPREDKIAAKVVEYLLNSSAGMNRYREEPRLQEKSSEKNSELTTFIKKLTSILAPAAVLATIIGSDTGGLRVFMSSIKVLGNVLGVTFAPVMFMGAAAVLMTLPSWDCLA